MDHLFGKNRTPKQVRVVVIVAVLTALLSVFTLRSFAVSVVALVLFAVIAADLGGGVASNFTKSTSKYYSKNKKLQQQFLAMHVLYLPLLAFTFGSVHAIHGAVSYVAAIGLYFLTRQLEGLAVIDKSIVQTAYVLVIVGVIYTLLEGTVPDVWFAVLIMLKLGIAFPYKTK